MTGDWPIGECRSCHAAIIWGVTEAKGLPMPMDALPSDDGNVIIVGKVGTAPLVRVLGQPSMLDDGERRMSHHATCPDGKSWKRSR